MPPESEIVGQRVFDRLLFGFVRCKIETLIDFWVEIVEVDRRWDNAIFDCQYRGERFDGSGSTKQVPGH